MTEVFKDSWENAENEEKKAGFFCTFAKVNMLIKYLIFF